MVLNFVSMNSAGFSIESELSVRRTLLPFGFHSVYRADILAQQIYLPQLVDAAIREIVAPLVLGREKLVDFKGRDRQNLIDRSIPAQMYPRADELFFVAGSIVSSPLAKKSAGDFQVAVESMYVPSPDNHMLHSPQVRREGLPADIALTVLGRLIPVRLRYFRLGFDLYKPRFLSSTIGLVSLVTQTLLIEADEKNCIVSVDATGLRRKDETPLQAYELGQCLQRVLQHVFQFDFRGDYQKQL